MIMRWRNHFIRQRAHSNAVGMRFPTVGSMPDAQRSRQLLIGVRQTRELINFLQDLFLQGVGEMGACICERPLAEVVACDRRILAEEGVIVERSRLYRCAGSTLCAYLLQVVAM